MNITKGIFGILTLIGVRPGFPPAARKMALILVFIALGLFSTACSPLLSEGTGSNTGLQPALTFSTTNMMIDNGNDFVWSGVTLTINKNYRYQADKMPRGVSSIHLAEFRDAQGNAFNPQSMVPHQLNIQVQAGFENKPGSFDWKSFFEK
ncbi:hypothetical protein [Paenibacillus agricola]|uniref:Uncharacterized protein n=1 Tax=Paenibacillus agricola TaxID=2716264 RepID=A0ABX0JC62_9BACL|nr:hypothetical protein [Paenibacillus agricola]NHN34019.1 hypothetical protein [Paenibacillus agricola]